MPKVHPDKIEAQKQWDSDPCGASSVRDQVPESLDFYRAIRSYRYNEHAPWFDRVVGFDAVHGRDILEIGVGLGSDHYRFARARNRMTALDLSREHLRQSGRHLQLEGLSTRLLHGDAENLPFFGSSFDIVYAFGALHHTPDTQAAVEEIRRVLKPGGQAIIGLYHRYSWFLIFSVLLYSGVLHGGLWRKGWRRLLSEFEYRSNPGSASPLVKVLSRRSVRALFARFAHVRLQTCHVEASHFSLLGPVLRPLGRERLERWLGFGGWYLVARATKAGTEPAPE
jgi:SAM-dependent methyltransferase